MTLAQKLAQSFHAYLSCVTMGNKEWQDNHEEVIKATVYNRMPSGSGIDGGCHFDFTHSTKDKLVFTSSYHAMDENGMYDGWYDFKIIVTPSWHGVDVCLRGNLKKYNHCKDYLIETFSYALSKEV